MWLGKVANWIERAINRTSRVVNVAGVGILVLIMVLVTVDVCLRYFFDRPLSGSYEIVEFMLVIVVFGSIAYTGVKKGHIAIDVVVSRLPPSAQAVIQSIVSLVGMGLCFSIAWFTFLEGKSLWLAGQTTVLTKVPIYPFVWVAAFGFGLLGLVLLVNLLKYLARSLSVSGWQVWLGLLSGLALILLVSAYAVWGRALPWEISSGTVGVIGIVGLFLLLFTGMPVGFVMIFVGFLGYSCISGPGAAFGTLRTAPYGFTANYTYSVIALFVLMGEFAFHAGLTRELYNTAYKWVGQMRGGLAMATIAGSAGFATITSSTVASTASMGVVALPEMKKYKYDASLATASIAAGGSLAPLIPPSGLLVIYGIIARQPIGECLLAGFLPGVLLTILFMSTIYIRCRLNVLLGPAGEKTSIIGKIVSLKNTWSVLVLFLLVIGGIYFGVFTPTEGAAVGASGALAISLIRQKITRQTFIASLLETGKTTAMVMFILIGATIFSRFLTVTRIPVVLATFIGELSLPPVAIFALIILMYLILGCFLSTIPMVIITVPIFLPLLLALGFDPVWFGVIVVLVCEMGLITPPVAMNIFVIHGVAKDVPMYTIFRGIWPFLAAEIICVFILVAFPQIALFLPSNM